MVIVIVMRYIGVNMKYLVLVLISCTESAPILKCEQGFGSEIIFTCEKAVKYRSDSEYVNLTNLQLNHAQREIERLKITLEFKDNLLKQCKP